MALRSNALCSIAQVKSYMGIDSSVPEKDLSIELYVNSASDIVDKYLGYDPKTQTYTQELHSGTGTKFLVTNARPITTITTILEDGTAVTITNFINASWYIDGYDYTFVRGHNNYKVTYVAGYAASAMPPSITLAAVKIAATMMKEDGRTGSLGTSSISHGDGSRTFLDPTYETTLETIGVYRRYDG